MPALPRDLAGDVPNAPDPPSADEAKASAKGAAGRLWDRFWGWQYAPIIAWSVAGLIGLFVLIRLSCWCLRQSKYRKNASQAVLQSMNDRKDEMLQQGKGRKLGFLDRADKEAMKQQQTNADAIREADVLIRQGLEAKYQKMTLLDLAEGHLDPSAGDEAVEAEIKAQKKEDLDAIKARKQLEQRNARMEERKAKNRKKAKKRERKAKKQAKKAAQMAAERDAGDADHAGKARQNGLEDGQS